MEKIVAAKTSRGIKLAKLSTEIDGYLNMRLFITNDNVIDSNGIIYGFVRKFNQIIWDVKHQRVFPDIDNYEGEEKKEYIRECMEKCFKDEIDNVDLPYNEIYGVNNLERQFKSEDFIKLKQVEFFNAMPIPEKTKDFLNNYIDTIEEIEFSDSQLKNIYTQFSEPVKEVDEYVIYIGENSKYKGCVGKIIDNRDDVAPNLIEFNNINGKTIKYWSKEDNLVRFYI